MFHASDLIYSFSETHSLLDPLAPAEQARVIAQYQMLKRALREPLPELEETAWTSSSPHMILDLGCGPHGEWACDVTFDYPYCHVYGVSALSLYVQQAEMFRRMQDLPRARFLQMDFTRALCFPDAFFDVINGRFLCSFLTCAPWLHLLRECLRVLRPGGVLRLTECYEASCSSTACEVLSTYALYGGETQKPLMPSSHSMSESLPASPERFCLERLIDLIERTGFSALRSTTHVLDFSAGTPYQQSMYRNALAFFFQLASWLCQQTDLTQKRFDDLFEQMQTEMLDPAFHGHWTLQILYAQKQGGQPW